MEYPTGVHDLRLLDDAMVHFEREMQVIVSAAAHWHEVPLQVRDGLDTARACRKQLAPILAGSKLFQDWLDGKFRQEAL